MARGTLRLVGAAAVAVAALVTTLWVSRGDDTGPAVSRNPDAVAPEGVRIKVQVLNASATRGLARRATALLRDHGFDVVEIGNTAEQRDSTLVLDRSGHPDWARRVAAALGGAAVQARPDTSRYLDVTVLLGRAWRPPPQPFYP